MNNYNKRSTYIIWLFYLWEVRATLHAFVRQCLFGKSLVPNSVENAIRRNL